MFIVAYITLKWPLQYTICDVYCGIYYITMTITWMKVMIGSAIYSQHQGEEGVCFNQGPFAHPHPCNLFVASWVHHTIGGLGVTHEHLSCLLPWIQWSLYQRQPAFGGSVSQICIEQQHEDWHSLTRSCCTPRSSWASPIAVFFKCHRSAFCLLNESMNWKVFYKFHLYYCVSKVWPRLNVWHYQLEIVRNFESQSAIHQNYRYKVHPDKKL